MRTHMLFGALAAVVGAKNATSTGGLAGEWEQALLHGGCAKSGVHTCAGAEGKTPLVEATGQFSTPQLENKAMTTTMPRAAVTTPISISTAARNAAAAAPHTSSSTFMPSVAVSVSTSSVSTAASTAADTRDVEC